MKQTAAYEIMSCSYIMKSIEKHNLFQDEMKLKIQDMFGDNLGNQIITKKYSSRSPKEKRRKK